MGATSESQGGTLNINLDMAQVNAVLAQQPRLQVTMPAAAGGTLTLLEAARALRPGVTAADTNVNVLC